METDGDEKYVGVACGEDVEVDVDEKCGMVVSVAEIVVVVGVVVYSVLLVDGVGVINLNLGDHRL